MTSHLKVKMTKSRIKRPMTNEEFMKDLMNYSPYGAMCQVFILEAVRYYSEMVKNSKPDPDKEKMSKSFINPKLWRALATNINERCEARIQS